MGTEMKWKMNTRIKKKKSHIEGEDGTQKEEKEKLRTFIPIMYDKMKQHLTFFSFITLR